MNWIEIYKYEFIIKYGLAAIAVIVSISYVLYKRIRNGHWRYWEGSWYFPKELHGDREDK